MTEAPAIRVEGLRKSFDVAVRRPGLLGAVQSLVDRQTRPVHAVAGVSFSVVPGEMVGCLGPNGAGKSTTIKMLTGILVPSGGSIEVLGLVPYRRRTHLARQTGTVFGQRTQLWWDLPLIDSLELLKHVYRVPSDRFAANLRQFRELLDLDDFLHTPVRQLSLGQRMRGDLAAALLHDPSILYLDEPTIGLDVVAKHRIRGFLKEVNQQRGVTVLLTTHDMVDVEQLCQRLLIVDHGRLIYDGGLDEIRQRYSDERTLVVDLDESGGAEAGELHVTGAVQVRSEGPRRWLRFSRAEVSAPAVIAALSAGYAVRDVTIQDTPIEDVVRAIYEGRARTGGSEAEALDALTSPLGGI